MPSREEAFQLNAARRMPQFSRTFQLDIALPLAQMPRVPSTFSMVLPSLVPGKLDLKNYITLLSHP